MELFTIKRLEELLGVSHVALIKALKNIDYELKEVEGATKKVKHYRFDDLPQKYQERLREKLPELAEKKSDDTHISQTNFTKKYLLAPAKKQKEAVLKVKLVEFYLKKDASLNVQTWINETLKNSLEFDALGSVSQKQLFDWLAKYKEAKAKGCNIVEEFVDARGQKAGIKALSEEQKATAVRYFLKSSRPRMSEIHRNMCHTFGDAMASYDTLNKFYKQWRRENPLLCEFSRSPDSAKNKFLAAWGSESAKALYPNHFWELDSTPADVICDDGKRYAVLCAVDVFSRRAVFHVSETSSSYSIAQLLRKAILRFGIPEHVVIDNGRDYTSNHFESICINLGIEAVIVPPFSGDKKPHVERLFGTISRELFEQFPGYIGHNVAQREELQARMSFAQKIASQERWRAEFAAKSDEEKKLFRDAWKIKKENIGLEIGVLLSADDLQNWCDAWCEKMYEQRAHSGLDKKSPIAVWNSSNNYIKGVSDPRMLDLLLGESHVRRVGKKGIALDGCNYVHLDLIEYTGKHVYVMTPSDLGYILVYTQDMRFICVAEDIEHMGHDRHKIKAARKKSLSMMRQADKLVKEAMAMQDATIMDRIEAIDGEVKATGTVVMKRTERIDALLHDSVVIAQRDEAQYKEEQEVKLLASGRPVFNTFYERFMWCLENNEWNEKDLKIKAANMAVYEMAYADFARKMA
jgi:hypothetical protein